ncbi:hypothetical protein [Solitalea lacus]|uniref:hypothetical protein n=1 Tax=Solitalea lacus TaxID=2911172 RepID=UPI001EDB8E04|nr:hypothetical protein [Solitalea lacus]UKJ08079.1 hypothetical protein L2B55_02670 [Solitalea lacus]
MDNSQDFKKQVLELFIQKKENLLAETKTDQRYKIDGAEADKIDTGGLYESTTQQLLDEAQLQTQPINFLQDEIRTLKSINTQNKPDKVTFGALVQTNYAYFLIGAAQEPFFYDSIKFIGLSIGAPLYQKMTGLKVNSEFHFNGIKYVIIDIF